MSSSIYYAARRPEALVSSEREAIKRLVAKYAIENEIERYTRSGVGPNWESFCIYEQPSFSEPGVVFEGATKLPDNSEQAIWRGAQHWCALLSEIRAAIPRASWRVHIEDHDIAWVEERSAFDPSR
jgi:hypothetical protein